MPILTRLGCNTGGCHGRPTGQNGFHLSLFGYDPAGDFQALARDAGQRRLSRLAPERACSWPRRPAGSPHGGGPRLKVGSPEYQTLLAWVRDGAPEARGKAHGAVVKLTVEPGAAILAEPGPRQFRVVAALRRRPRARRDPAGFVQGERRLGRLGHPDGPRRHCSAAPRPI